MWYVQKMLVLNIGASLILSAYHYFETGKSITVTFAHLCELFKDQVKVTNLASLTCRQYCISNESKLPSKDCVDSVWINLGMRVGQLSMFFILAFWGKSQYICPSIHNVTDYFALLSFSFQCEQQSTPPLSDSPNFETKFKKRFGKSSDVFGGECRRIYASHCVFHPIVIYHDNVFVFGMWEMNIDSQYSFVFIFGLKILTTVFAPI